MTTSPKVLIPMADFGHDPTETSVPYHAFKAAGFEVHFATETGKAPACDTKMLEGWTQKLLGATAAVVKGYHEMSTTSEFQHPTSWSDPSFSLSPYSLVFLPGGHEKGVRQLIDSPIMGQQLATHFAETRKPSRKSVAAVCHGVLSLAEAKITDGEAKGKSVLHDAATTTLPRVFERTAFWGTRMLLGDYYKTYGAGSADCEDVVRGVLDNPEKQFKGSAGPSPWVVSDEKYNYVSARFPGDVELLAKTVVDMVKETTK